MEKRNKGKGLSVITSLGILFMLVGFMYLVYSLKTLNDSLKDKKEELSELTEKIKSNTDSLHYIEEKLKLKQNLLDSIIDQIEASDNQALQLKIDNKISINQALENTLKTKSLVKNYTQVVYIQVNDQNTEKYLNEIKLLESLKENNYKAYGYDMQKKRANNTVRYFHPKDSVNAVRLGETITRLTGINVKTQYITGLERKVPDNQLEVWLNKN
ncbi:hypothetical protein [Aquimarina brevivitae]|uniref:Uncharacterized protein n=1 Tax=Aquimarina brevivitae TaxID=323412 RepID=A0A4Q7P4C3_9FLAO|nr:hypothetical protein [Aquimarina brevivitae]RZS93542.1 hypothetical protein EV197_2122 [Aquimarina brevivitae]